MIERREIFVRFVASALGVCCASTGFAQTYLPDIPVHHPAIQYFKGTVDDAVARLSQRLNAGTANVEFNRDGLGYLPSLLQLLGVNPDSQALVFSKTSFQAPKIAPDNPRAIYFGDDVAIGYVRGGDGFELAAIDPKQGIVFYTFPIRETERPAFTRGEVCLRCHQGPATSGVPGIYVGSVIPNPLGAPLREGAIITDDRTEFKDRWGGWYVNAISGEPTDRANAVASNPADPDSLDTEGKQNRPALFNLFNPKGYPANVSDIVALMTFEHQTQMINYMTRVGWEARILDYDAEHGKTGLDFQRAQMNSDIDAMTEYMLFDDAKPLRDPIQGVSNFTKTFPRRGPRDSHGRSLRDFDLTTRLFRYPVSYMIYSKEFDALPDFVRERVYRRLFDVLTSDPKKDDQHDKVFPRTADRHATLEILFETKPGLPAYWRKAGNS
jgi:hypothetical protein